LLLGALAPTVRILTADIDTVIFVTSVGVDN
jgi:hypothetical protein